MLTRRAIMLAAVCAAISSSTSADDASALAFVKGIYKQYGRHVTNAGPGKAGATVKFIVDKRPTTIILDLVQIKNDWRVSEIIWPDAKPGNLRSLHGQLAQ
jgi:hypothetical protein